MSYRIFGVTHGWVRSVEEGPSFTDDPNLAMHFGSLERHRKAKAFVDGEEREVSYEYKLTPAEMMEEWRKQFSWMKDFALEVIEVADV